MRAIRVKRQQKMRVGLIDCDSHNFFNFSLMKISFYHKQMENTVEFTDMGTYYDVLYVSKIFTESKEPELPDYSVMFWGGSGYDLENRLPEEIENCYPELTKDTAYGFLTRGCPRKNHSFCITLEKDGYISRKAADLSGF